MKSTYSLALEGHDMVHVIAGRRGVIHFRYLLTLLCRKPHRRSAYFCRATARPLRVLFLWIGLAPFPLVFPVLRALFVGKNGAPFLIERAIIRHPCFKAFLAFGSVSTASGFFIEVVEILVILAT